MAVGEISDDVVQAVRGWLKLGCVAVGEPLLTDEQIIPADVKGVRPDRPYATVKVTSVIEDTFDAVVYDDDGPAGAPRRTVQVGESALVSVQGFGSATADWFRRARLGLFREDVRTLLDPLNLTIVERGTISNLARLLGTAFEDRFSVEFVVSYVLALEPETLLKMSAVALDVDFTRGDGSPSVDVDVTRAP